jgi:protocatechuate 3,4-dioxygenase beta subunit
MNDAQDERRSGRARTWLFAALAAGFAVLAGIFVVTSGGRESASRGGAPGPIAAAPAGAPSTVVAAGTSERLSVGGDADAPDGSGWAIHPGVRLAGPGWLEGRVQDSASGAGVEGARVELFALTPTGKDMLTRIYRAAKFDAAWPRRLEPVATTESGPEGRFRFSGVRVGTYFVEARGAWHVPEEPTLARVDASGAGGPIDVRVRAGGRVIGRVERPDGSGVGRAKVLLYPGHTHVLAAARSGDFRLFEAESAPSGEFLFAGIPPGEGYLVSAISEGFALTHAGPFAVRAGEDASVEVGLRRGARVRGRVLAQLEGAGEADLVPVPGAHVGVLPRGLRDLALSAEVLEATHAVTDAQGEYVLQNAPWGELDVAAAKQGLLPAKSPPLRVAEGQEAEAEPVILRSGPMVTLRCSDDRGEPLAGVNTSWYVTDFDALQFEPTFTPLMLQAVRGFEFPRSDAAGLVLAGPFPGSPPHTIFAWLAGYGFQTVEWSPSQGDAVDVVLARSGAAEGIVVDLEHAEPVTRFEVVSERRLEVDDEAPSGVNPFSGGQWIESPDGRFRIENLGTWESPVRFRAPGYLPEDVSIPVQPGATTKGIIVKLRRGGTVRGRVLDAAGEPVRGAQVVAMDERGRPVAGRLRTPRASTGSGKRAVGQEIALVSMDLFAGLGVIGPGFVLSAPDGTYELTGLAPGTVVIHAAERDYADAQSQPIEVPEGDPLEGVDLVLRQGGGLYGFVHDRFGAPVSGAVLVAVSTDRMARTDPSANWVRQGSSDAQGAYRIEHLEGGSYFLACTRGDEALNLTSFLGTLNFDLVTVPADEMLRYDLIDSSSAAVRVSGTVSSGGEPVRGGGLFAMSFEGENVLGLDVKITSVESDGSYAFAGLLPGAYSMTYQGDGPDVRMDVEIPDAPDVRLDLLLPSGSIEGRVLALESGQPVPRAELTLARLDGPAPTGLFGSLFAREGREMRTYAGEAGEFRFRGLQQGSYVLKAGGPRFGEGRGRFAPTPPEELKLGPDERLRGFEIRLAPSLELSGSVVDGAGQPVEGARVLAFPHESGGGRPPSARSSADGSFAMRGLAPGGYDVTASASDRGTSAVREIVLGSEPSAPLVIELRPGVPVACEVRDAQGAPLQGALGRLVALTKSGQATTGGLDQSLEGLLTGEGVSRPDGILELGEFAPGSYRLEVSRGSLSHVRSPVVVEEGGKLFFTVELK